MSVIVVLKYAPKLSKGIVYCSVTVTKYQDQGNLRKSLLEVYSCRGLVSMTITAGNMAAGR